MGKFRTTFVLPVLLLNVVALTLAGNGYAGERTWLYYGTSLDFFGYFSPETIQCFPNGEIKVWEKRILTKKYIAGLVEYAKKNDKDNIHKYNEAKYENIQDGLNCNNRLIVNYSYATYTNDNDIIDISENDNVKWAIVIPESIADKLLDVVCGYCNNEKVK